VLFDCPGQIELYSHCSVFRTFVEYLRRQGWSIAAVYCIDCQFVAEPAKFVAGALQARSPCFVSAVAGRGCGRACCWRLAGVPQSALAGGMTAVCCKPVELAAGAVQARSCTKSQCCMRRTARVPAGVLPQFYPVLLVLCSCRGKVTGSHRPAPWHYAFQRLHSGFSKQH